MAGMPPINVTPTNQMAQGFPQTLVSQTDPRLLAARMMSFRLGMYRTFGAYYGGQHRLAYASEKFRTAFGRLFYQFADNLCPTIVNCIANRLTVIDFCVENGPSSLGKNAWKFWTDQRLPRKSKDLHREVLRSGDAYVIVWPDPDKGVPTLYPQLAEQMTVFYDDEVPGKILWAAKSWQNQDNFIRLNMYYPDRLEKWITVRKMNSMPTRMQFWTKFIVPGETWPLVNPSGKVPVFHFANNAPPGKFGSSELKNALPIQDLINKSVIDLAVAMEYVSYPQRYAVGMELEVDEDQGMPITPFQPSVDRLWTVADKDVRFGEFSQADLSSILRATNDLRMELARVTETPLHYMMPMEMPPSGDALRTLEEPLVKKVIERAQSFGDTWADALTYAMSQAGLCGPDDRLTTKWTNPQPKSGLEDAQTLQIKKAIGVSTEQCLEEMGYTESDIEEMQQENEEEAQRTQEQAVANAAAMAVVTPAGPTPMGGQSQPAGKTSPSVSPHADGQRINKQGKPTTATPVKGQ